MGKFTNFFKSKVACKVTLLLRCSTYSCVLLIAACGGGGGGGGENGGGNPSPNPTTPVTVTPVSPASINFSLGLEAPEKISMPYPPTWERGDGGAAPGAENDLIVQYKTPLDGTEDLIYDSVFLLRLDVDSPVSGDGVSNFQQVSSAARQVAGQDALEVIFDADISGLEEYDLRFLQTTFEFNDEIFAVLYLAERNVFDRWLDVVRYMVSNLRLGQIVFDDLGGGSGWGEDIGKPAFASDGENYLVVICREDREARQIDLVGRLIYGDRSMGDEFVIHPDIDVSTNDCGYTSHTLTYDGFNYMLVWASPGQVLAKRISTLGQLVDINPIEVSEYYVDYGFEPSVAFDGTRYLVVWNEPNVAEDVRGAFLYPDGTVTPSFTIAAGLDEIYTESASGVTTQVVYGDNQYLVLWNQYFFSDESYDPANPIYAQLLDLNGNTQLPEPLLIRADDGSKHPRYPQVAYDGAEYLIAWIEGELSSSSVYSRWAIHAKKVDPSGTIPSGSAASEGVELVPSTLLVDRGRDIIRDHLDLSFERGRYHLFWSTYLDEASGVYGISISPDLSEISDVKAVAGTDADTYRGDLAAPALPIIAYSSTESLVVWASDDGTVEAWVGNLD